MRPRVLAAALAAAVTIAPAAPAAGRAAALVGMGDQHASMFDNPLFVELNVPIVRYIAPYDAMNSGSDARAADAFITAAQATGAKVLVAFYHSRVHPLRMPSTRAYARAVRRFIRAFPAVREYQPWNEANRGNVPGLFKSPTPRQAADYYRALRRACRRCTVTGLDLLDGSDMKPALRYLRRFQKHARPAPRLWGLHNYSDTNRNSTRRTRQFLRATRGRVWLTETGGIVRFGRSFPGGRRGERRAARALRLTFRIADAHPRVERVYIFQWSGAPRRARFDAGLTNLDGTPRPGYRVVRDHLGV